MGSSAAQAARTDARTDARTARRFGFGAAARRSHSVFVRSRAARLTGFGSSSFGGFERLRLPAAGAEKCERASANESKAGFGCRSLCFAAAAALKSWPPTQQQPVRRGWRCAR